MKRWMELPEAGTLARLVFVVCSGFLLMLFCLTDHGRASDMKVQGTVYSGPGKPAGRINVSLMKIEMAQKPTITPAGKTLTDGEGRFEIRVEPFEENVFFRITVGSGVEMTGSEPFRMTPDNPVRTMDIMLPQTLTGLSHLTFLKHLIVFEALEEALQITEVIYLSNDTDNVIRTGGTPYVRSIPGDAVNFQFFDRQGRVKAFRQQGRVHFNMAIPPGRHQLLFSYDIPTSQRSHEFRAQLPPGIPEFEIVTPVNALELVPAGNQSSMRMTSQEKQFDSRRYRSTTFFPPDGWSEIQINIKGIPLSQERFFYPAFFLAAVLIFGLFIYLARKPRTDNDIRS